MRDRGFAVDDEEDVLGVMCIAATFSDHAGMVAGAISATGLSHDIQDRGRERLADDVRAAADRITVAAGRRRSLRRGAAPMRALTVRRPGEVELEQRPDPQPGAGELLIAPVVVGMCGTDLDIIDGTIDPAFVRYPIVLGHEWAGRVVAGNESIPAGTRVVVEGLCAVWPLRRMRGRSDQPLPELRRVWLHPRRRSRRPAGRTRADWCIRSSPT